MCIESLGDRELAQSLAARHGLAYPAELDALLTARLRGLEITTRP